MKPCPYCAEDIPAQATICPVCGQNIQGVRPDRPRSAKSSSNTWIIVIAVLGGAALLVVPCLIALLLPAVQQAREAARRTQCKNNLKIIGLALHNYHDVYGTFPPAYIADSAGKPMHSWRVLILPFIEQQALYNTYNFSEPWDSPANEHVLRSMPPVFACPTHGGPGGTNTNYAAVFGPHSIFQGPNSIDISDIVDGTSNTAMVGETTMPIPWTSPQDVDVTVSPGINKGAGFGSAHRGGAHFLLGDGAVRFISENISDATLQSLWTIDGKEIITEF